MEKKLDLFNENKLQDLSVVRGGTTSENGGGTLSAAEMANVVFEEEGASITKPFGTTWIYDPNGHESHRDIVIFGRIVVLI